MTDVIAIVTSPGMIPVVLLSLMLVDWWVHRHDKPPVLEDIEHPGLW